MSWTKPTTEGLTATLSSAEVTAFGRSAGFEDAATVILSQTAATVRGFVRAGGVRLSAADGLVPPSLLAFAYDFAAYRVLKRMNIRVGEDRRKAYEDAMEMFRRVAEGKMAVEPDVDDDGTSLPSVTPAAAPANPARMLD